MESNSRLLLSMLEGFDISSLNTSAVNDILERLKNESETNVEEMLGTYVTYRAYMFISVYIPPILFLLGMVGNLLLFIVLSKTSFLRSSTRFYLKSLTVADTLILLFGLLGDWIAPTFGMDIKEQSNILCKLLTILAHHTSHFSAWLIVAVTVERFIVVCYPLKRPLCSKRTSKCVVLGIATTLFVANLHFMWTMNVREVHNESTSTTTVCSAADTYEHFIDNVWPWFDTLLYSLLPFSVLVCINSSLICRVFFKTAQQLRRSSNLEGLVNKAPLVRRRVSIKKRERRLTLMLLLVSFVFIATTLPVCLLTILHHSLNTSGNTEDFLRNILLRKLAEMVMYVNHCVNFYVYLGVDRMNRTLLKNTLLKKNDTNEIQTNMTNTELFRTFSPTPLRKTPDKTVSTVV